MLTLGIETSCDETSAALTEGRKVLSNVVSSSVHLHKKYGGVVPEIASRFHVEYIVEVVKKALAAAGKRLEDVELISVTNGPGLVGALLIGVSFAKSLSYSLGVPLIGVNHIVAHIYSSFLSDGPAPEFPFVGLVVSGGHTSLFLCKDIDRYTLLGQTQDDAIGEAYDKVSKLLGLGYPGGPAIEKAARMASVRDAKLFPRSMLGKDSFDFSFSGVKTAVLYFVQKLKEQDALAPEAVNEIAYSFQEAILDVLVKKAFRASSARKVKSIVIGGGVVANSRLRELFTARAGASVGVKVFFPEFVYSMDNAAMVAFLGEALYKKGYKSDLSLCAEPNLKIQEEVC